jgi:WD40 repeat protein
VGERSTVPPVPLPAPLLPPGPREALVIATANYDDPALRRLRAPVHDAESIASTLEDTSIGRFCVRRLVDPAEETARRGIISFLRGRDAEDTVLVYVSCHGILDGGHLYFAATDTDTENRLETAIDASTLLDWLGKCHAERQVLILDCCFSGAFADGRKGRPDDLKAQLYRNGKGLVVLTASGDLEYSYERKPLKRVPSASVFTAGLVEGLRTGTADRDGDGFISVDEAYDYAYQHVNKSGFDQTPRYWQFHGTGARIVLARSPAGRQVTPAELPERIRALLYDRSPRYRRTAVDELADLLTDPDPSNRLAAQIALKDVARLDILEVRERARAHLGEAEPPEEKSPRKEKPKNSRPSTIQSAIPQAVTDILTGHTGSVRAVAFNHDGTMLATGSYDTTARIWDPAQGRHLRTLAGHKDWVRDVAFSSDGTLLATASDDGTARVWSPSTGRHLRTLRGHTGKVWVVAFSRAGSLATAGEDGTVRLWEPARGRHLRTLEGHTSWLGSIAFNPDGTLLATSGGDKAVLLWDPASGDRLHTLKGHGSPVLGVAFSPHGGTLLATIGSDKTVMIWDPASGTRVHLLNEGDYRILRRTIGPFLERTFVSGRETELMFRDSSIPVKIRTLEHYVGWGRGVAFSPDEALLFVAWGNALRVWDLVTGRFLHEIQGKTGRIRGLALSPRGNMLATVSGDNTVRLWH